MNFRFFTTYLYQLPKYLLLLLKVIIFIPYLEKENSHLFQEYSLIIFGFILIRNIIYIPFQLIGHEIIHRSKLEISRKHIIFVLTSLLCTIPLIFINKSFFYLLILVFFDFLLIYSVKLRFRLFEIEKKWDKVFLAENIDPAIDLVALVLVYSLNLGLGTYVLLFSVLRIPFIIFYSVKINKLVSYKVDLKPLFKPFQYFDNTLFAFSAALAIEGSLVVSSRIFPSIDYNNLYLNKYYLSALITAFLVGLNPLTFPLFQRIKKNKVLVLKIADTQLIIVCSIIVSCIMVIDKVLLTIITLALFISLNNFIINLQKRLILQINSGVEYFIKGILSIILLLFCILLENQKKWFILLLLLELIYFLYSQRRTKKAIIENV